MDPLSIRLNTSLLRSRVPNLTVAAKNAGLRPATVSNLCTGKIPLGRAEIRTIVLLAKLANCTVDDLIIIDDYSKKIETGIKTIDLFAPLVLNSTIGLIARPGMGQLALLAEVFHRLKNRSFKTVTLTPKQEDPGLKDLLHESDFVASSFEEIAVLLSDEWKNENILLVVDRAHVISGELGDFNQTPQLKEVNSLTTFLMDLSGEAPDDDLPFGPLDTIWQFDAELVAQKYYPAIHPLFSISDSYPLDKKQNKLQQDARKVLRRYRELRALYAIRGYEKMNKKEENDYMRGQKLEAYLTQPFFIAEPHTERKGSFVKITALFDDMNKLLTEDLADVEASLLLYKGDLSTVL